MRCVMYLHWVGHVGTPVRRGMLANRSGILNVKPGACKISRLATSFSTSAILLDTLSASLQAQAAHAPGCKHCKAIEY